MSVGYDETSELCVYHLTAAPRMRVSSDRCTGRDCSANSGLLLAIIGATTAALLLVLVLSTTVVVIGIEVGIHRRRKKKQYNMIERNR